MRKFLVLVILVFLTANFSLSAHSGCSGYGRFGMEGFAAALEFGFDGVNEDVRMAYLTTMIGYGHSFFDKMIETYAELNYTFGFRRNGHPHYVSYDEDGVFPQTMYLNLMARYNLYPGRSEDTKLSFSLKNVFDKIIIAPRSEVNNNIKGVFSSSATFYQKTNIGQFNASASLPVTYIQVNRNADTRVGLNFSIGWDTKFELGLDVTLITMLAPNESSGIDSLEFFVGYGWWPFYFCLWSALPLKDIEDRGISLSPKVEYSFRDFGFFVKCEFEGIGVKKNDDGYATCISPGLGFVFVF